MTPVLLAVAAAVVLEAGDRRPLPVAFTTPTGASGRLGLSEIIRGLDEAFDASTDLRVEPMDTAVVDQCARKLSCVVRKARPDYQRERLRRPDGTHAPYRAHSMRVRAAGRETPRLLLVVGVLTAPERGDRVLLQLVSTDLALESFHEADRKPGWKDRVETEVFERAIVASTRSDELRDVRGLQSFLESALSVNLLRALKRHQHHQPFGGIDLRSSVEGASVRLDGRLLGRAELETKIVDVRSGRRELKIEAHQHLPFSAEVKVAPGRTTRVEASLRRSETRLSRDLRRTTFWTGIAAVGASATVFAWAAARADGQALVCFEGPDCATGERLVGTPPLAAVGAGLLGAGLGWSVGAFTIDRRRSVPWPSWVLGAALGVGAYGLVAATE
ncbi:MAG: PEGA domain-containing protein [Myxococcota bacterium]